MVRRGALSAARIRRFRSLHRSDRRLFLSALPLLTAVRLALWLAPTVRVRAMLERIWRAPAGAPAPAPGEADRVGWAVASASRFVPAATCLPQALAAEALLRGRGHPASVRFGVARAGDRMEAHAWVESYGRVVIGDHDLHRYVELRPAARVESP